MKVDARCFIYRQTGLAQYGQKDGLMDDDIWTWCITDRDSGLNISDYKPENY